MQKLRPVTTAHIPREFPFKYRVVIGKLSVRRLVDEFVKATSCFFGDERSLRAVKIQPQRSALFDGRLHTSFRLVS